MLQQPAGHGLVATPHCQGEGSLAAHQVLGVHRTVVGEEVGYLGLEVHSEGGGVLTISSLPASEARCRAVLPLLIMAVTWGAPKLSQVVCISLIQF